MGVKIHGSQSRRKTGKKAPLRAVQTMTPDTSNEVSLGSFSRGDNIKDILIQLVTTSKLGIWHQFEVGIFRRGFKYVVSWESAANVVEFADADHAVDVFLMKVNEIAKEA